MPHKAVVSANATTTKVRMVFDASDQPHHLGNNMNDCMNTGPPLKPLLWDILAKPLLWDILARSCMLPYLLLREIEKTFLEISLKDDRDAFLSLFNINTIFDLQGCQSELNPVTSC